MIATVARVTRRGRRGQVRPSPPANAASKERNNPLRQAGLALRRGPEALRAVVGGVVAVAVGIFIAHAFSLSTPNFVLTLGGLVGLSYGLLGVTLVLVFRISRVVNFAQPAIGAFATALLPFLVFTLHLPYWIGFAVVLLVGFALGAFIDFAVVRRFAAAPRVVVAAATIGVAITLASGTTQLGGLGTSQTSLTPPGLFEFTIGALLVTRSYTGLIIAAPLLVIALTLFLTRTRYGLAIRASATNPDAASLAGISPRSMTALAWGIAGLCAATLSAFYTTALPAASDAGTGSFFASTGILPAIAAAAIARMTSYTRALMAGVVLGMIEQVLLWSNTYANETPTVLFVITLVALLFLRSVGGRADPTGAWSAVTLSRPLPKELSTLLSVRLLPGLVSLAAAALIAWRGLTSDVAAISWTALVTAVIIALSAGLITGLGGDLSLGQYGIAGVGAAATYVTILHTGNELLGLLAAALCGGLTCAALAYPALRVGGLTLTILTVSFATMLPTGILSKNWLFGANGHHIAQPVIGSVALTSPRVYFVWTLMVASVCALVVRAVWHSGFGRTVLAARDNTSAARSFSIPTTRVRLQMFFIAGAVAGLAGAVIVQSSDVASASSFPPDFGALVVLGVILGGLGVAYGAPLGTLWVLGIPALTGSSPNAVVAAYTGALALLLASPRGAAHLLTTVRDVAAIGLGRLHGVPLHLSDLRGQAIAVPQPTATTGVSDQPAARAEPGRARFDTVPPGSQRLEGAKVVPKMRRLEFNEVCAPGSVLLDARGLSATFGPIRAVQSVDLTVRAGEIVGLIGPNGAGKTTTLEILSGFVRSTRGQISYCGRDVTKLSPEARASRGLVRSFQDAALFPTMSVLDVVMLSLERQSRSSATLAVAGFERASRRRRAVAYELVDFFGLGRYVSRTIQELSTGTRRIVELACLTSLQPRVLLLDEPSAGIAQRETEALAGLLLNIRRALGVSFVLVEHDIPLVMSLSDRMVAMADGRVICTGAPDEVRNNDAVIECYLGARAEAIERSDLRRPQPLEAQTVSPNAR